MSNTKAEFSPAEQAASKETVAKAASNNAVNASTANSGTGNQNQAAKVKKSSAKERMREKDKARARYKQLMAPSLREVLCCCAVLALLLAGLLYSVYQQRQRAALSVGALSPRRYVSPIDTTVVDRLATERERQQARAQIATIYSSDANLQALVFEGLRELELDEATERFLLSIYERPEGVSREEVPVIARQAASLSRDSEATLVLLEDYLLATTRANIQLTEAAREAAAAAIPATMRTLRAGEVIVDTGQTLNAEHLRILESVGLYRPRHVAWRRTLLTLFSCIAVALLLSGFFVYQADSIRLAFSRKQLMFVTALLALSLIAQRLALLVHPSFIVVACLPLFLAVSVSLWQAFIIGVWLSLSVAFFVPGAAFMTLLVVLVGCLASCWLSQRFHSRVSLLLAGALGGGLATLVVLLYQLLSGSPSLETLALSSLWVIGGSTLAGVLALAILPFAESHVGFLTEFRLLELTNPAQPLLQRLTLEAPGSYQHSLIIANLVDRAVSNIGGNALLARVGALYHDVGKLKRPQFFVENQFSGDNPHDNISPHLSYLIITNHVRDGLELLREYKLPRSLEAFVSEHHGTTVLSYFYRRALEGKTKVDEFNFRYAGPRPRSKESAVLMIADAVESASRTLNDPNQTSIRSLIERIVQDRLQDDQLANSQLNFHDLEVIITTFEQMLTAILHRRIQYPSSEEINKLKQGKPSDKADKSHRNPQPSPSSPQVL